MEERVLPEGIIHHIQSFLTGKQAARTTIFSKSWYRAWLTRPNLDFDQRDFIYRFNGAPEFRKLDGGFSGYARKTLQRYDELNLKIESFKLGMKCLDFDNYYLANEFIAKALKIGAIDLNFDNFSRNSLYRFPREVIGSETLTRLSVAGCSIGYGKVRCLRLKSLNLCDVKVEGDMILDILSSCPLIEELVLPGCESFTKFDSDGSWTVLRNMELSPAVEFRKQYEECRVNGHINLFELHKLKKMFLDRVEISAFFFSDFSSKFPCMKDLSVHHCYGYRHEIRIHSRSLECISFAHNWTLNANFNVPSVKNFTFSGHSVPCVSFEFDRASREREWESLLFISCNDPCVSWFLSLNKLLTNLSLSRVSLSLDFEYIKGQSYNYMGGFVGFPKPKVENLTVRVPGPLSYCYVLLNGLFSCCHPMFITQYWLPKSCTAYVEKVNNDNLLKLLCETIVREGSEDCYISSRSRKRCLRDLEQVNVEFFEEDLVGWKPLPWKDASASRKNERVVRFQGWIVVRFQLGWRVEPSTLKCCNCQCTVIEDQVVHMLNCSNHIWGLNSE